MGCGMMEVERGQNGLLWKSVYAANGAGDGMEPVSVGRPKDWSCSCPSLFIDR